MISEVERQTCWTLLSQTAREEPRAVFALLDGARAPGLLDRLAEWDVESACVRSGESDPVALERAPYLARVPERSAFWRWLAAEGWGKQWGIFALAPQEAELDTLLRDLRECVQARLPDQRIVYFRFFDPRVWRPFFPTCEPAQLRTLFGRVMTAFACESEDGRALLLDTVQEGRPRRQVLALSA